jgi:hypothetical protein
MSICLNCFDGWLYNICIYSIQFLYFRELNTHLNTHWTIFLLIGQKFDINFQSFAPGFVNYKKTRLPAASDKVYQLLAHGRWFSPGTPVFSTIKTGRHNKIVDIPLVIHLPLCYGKEYVPQGFRIQ